MTGDGVLFTYLIIPSVPGELKITAVTLVSVPLGSVKIIFIAEVVPFRSNTSFTPDVLVF
jgi:hypothetical protein